MEKIKVGGTIFELSKEAQLVLQDYLNKLDIHFHKKDVDENYINFVHTDLEKKLFQQLEKNPKIDKSDVEAIVESIGFPESKKSQKKGFLGSIFAFFASMFVFLARFLMLVLYLCLGIVRVILLMFPFFLFLGLFIVGFILIPIIFLDWNILNQDMSSIFTDAFKLAFVALEVSMLILTVWIFGAFFKKKNVGKGWLVTGFILFIFSINAFVYYGLDLMKRYHVTYSTEYDYQFDVSQTKELNLQGFEKLNIFPFGEIDFKIGQEDHIFTLGNGHMFWYNFVEVHDNNTKDQVFIKLVAAAQGDDDFDSNKYFNKLSSLEFNRVSDIISLATPRGEIFKEKVDYRFPRFYMVISKPKGISIVY